MRDVTKARHVIRRARIGRLEVDELVIAKIMRLE